jgi:hypothetical protein
MPRGASSSRGSRGQGRGQRGKRAAPEDDTVYETESTAPSTARDTVAKDTQHDFWKRFKTDRQDVQSATGSTVETINESRTDGDHDEDEIMDDPFFPPGQPSPALSPAVETDVEKPPVVAAPARSKVAEDHFAQPAPMESAGATEYLGEYMENAGRNFPRVTEQNLKDMELTYKLQRDKLASEVEVLAGVLLVGHDKMRHDSFKDALTKGSVDPRTSLGVWFRDALAKKPVNEKEAYGHMNRSEAAAFRLKWAKAEYDKFMDEKVHMRSWTRIDITKGHYRSVSQLVIDDGGWQDEDCIEGVQKLIEKALAMGDPWIRIHPQTGRMLFLKLSFEFAEEFAESWSSFRKQFTSGTTAAGAKAGIEQTSGIAGTADAVEDGTGTADADPKAKGKAKAKSQLKAKPKSQAPDKDKKFEELWGKSVAARKFYLSTMATGVEIDQVISEDESWDWARNAQNQGKLKSLAADVRNSMSVFQKAFLSEEPSAIRKRFNKDVISVELCDLLLKKQVNLLADWVKLLQKRKVG